MEDLSQEVQKMKDTTLSSVQLPFKGTFSGASCLLFPTESAKTLVIALTGEAEDPDTLDSLREATLTEIGNIVLNGVMGSLAKILNHQIIYSVPFYQETTIQRLLQPTLSGSSEIILWAQTQFTIQDYDLTGDIMLIFGIPDLGHLINAVSEMMHATTSPHAST
jgi:chemotaxis protein CheC